MNLYDFILLALEDYFKCVIWDCNKRCVVFEGELSDIPDKYLNMDLGSWEITEDGKIGLNIV